jgi:hypothetical protein
MDTVLNFPGDTPLEWYPVSRERFSLSAANGESSSAGYCTTLNFHKIQP